MVDIPVDDSCVIFFNLSKALVHDNSTLKYVTKLACQNPMSVSGRNWRDCINFALDISMISMNVKQMYG